MRAAPAGAGAARTTRQLGRRRQRYHRLTPWPAPLGFWLAKQLSAAGHAVTVLVPCAADDKKLAKAPYTSDWAELRSAGVATPFGSLAAVAGARFDVVVDNSGKDRAAVDPVVALAQASGAAQFLFVSSAGMYKVADTLPAVEGDAVKADAGHAEVEAALAAGAGGFASWASFRPQYLTGRGSNKDCEEWFFDRLARGRPLPVPGAGCQLTVVSHAEDVAAMLAAAVAAPSAAHGGVFNAVADRAVTLDGFARLCAAAAGLPPPALVHWDPKALAGVADVKDAFPFRPVHFYSEPRAAAARLPGWAPKWDLRDALRERWAFYVASGRDKKDKAFPQDDAILAAVAAAAAKA